MTTLDRSATLDPRGLEAALHAVEGEGLTSDGGTPHGWRCEYPDRYPDYCKCPIEMAESAVTAYLDVAQPVVTTVEELEGLEVGTIILDRFEDEAYTRIVGPRWVSWNEQDGLRHTEVALPARVTWRPRESA